MYLVVDDNKRTTLWEKRPVYFSDRRRWHCPGTAILDNMNFPPLKKIAADLGIVPGREGIPEVDFVLRPTATPPAGDENKAKAIIAEPRNSVAQFARMMEGALKRNEEKGGWAYLTDEFLFDRLIEETQELLMALKTDDNDVLQECCDVANFAMMIADNRGMPGAKVTADKE